MKPRWQGDEAEQREFVRQHYGQKALDEFIRGGTMALDAYERAERDRISDPGERVY